MVITEFTLMQKFQAFGILAITHSVSVFVCVCVWIDEKQKDNNFKMKGFFILW